MHASMWRFTGDPDHLMRRWDALPAEIPPSSLGCTSACARRKVRERPGRPEPAPAGELPVLVAIVDGAAA